jgi:hypothetical protein
MTINYDSLYDTIKDTEGEVRTVGKDFYENKDGRFDNIVKLWGDAGYTTEKVEWINYYPDIHFDSSIVEEFSKSVGLNTIRAWVSCVRPGKSAPWHQDIDDNMEEYLSKGELVRYSVTICDPEHGQFFAIESKPYYMLTKGSLILWDNHLAWHGASNCGFKNHYLFHFLGYK